MSEPWRRPIRAQAEETVGFYSGEPKRSLLWYINGPNSEDDEKRLRDGLACVECLTTFPAKPELANIRVWKKYAHEWNHLRPEKDTMVLIAKGLCPTCASEVSPEMFAFAHRGVDPHKPKSWDEL